MTTPRDPDALLAAYLAVGMEVLPDRVVDSVLDEVHRTHQRRVLWPARRTRPMSRTTVAAAAVVARVALGWCVLIQRGLPEIAAPSPTPSRSPAPAFRASWPQVRRPMRRCRPARVPANGRRLGRHRVDGHASLWPHGGAAPRWPGARRGRRQRDATTPPRSLRPGHRDLVRHREAWSGRGVAPRSRPRCCATARCSPGMTRAPRCTTRTAGPGGHQDDGSHRSRRVEPLGRGHGAARRQGARGPRRRQLPDLRPRQRDLDRHGAADTTRGHPHADHAARWQGARGGRRRHVSRRGPGRSVRSGHGHLDRHWNDGDASP